VLREGKHVTADLKTDDNASPPVGTRRMGDAIAELIEKGPA